MNAKRIVSNGSRLARRFFTARVLMAAALLSPGMRAQTVPDKRSSETIQQMSGSFESLARHVSPAVVEILVTGFSADTDQDEDNRSSGSFARERSLGSGVIIDPNGYIVTNHHVVEGAERVRVALNATSDDESQPFALLKPKGRVLKAQIVGADKTIDLAVLKVEATGLPTLPLGRYDRLRQGQIVLAFPNPEGLQNSVSLGLVSSVLRQPDPDTSMVYIQTDAAINPGNSGGPLVDVDGNVVGINTFIYTKSGGNEGIGFAIPSGMVRYAYEQIRKNGRVKRRAIGADLQSVTPELAGALGLSQEWGVIVSDVHQDGPAEKAGLKIGDLVLGIDGQPVDSLPIFALALYLVNNGTSAKLEILRGSRKLTLDVPVFEPSHDRARLAELSVPQRDVIPRLGIMGVTITPEISDLLGGLRITSGVLVTGTVVNRLAVDSGLLVGDVIHSLNRVPTISVDSLRSTFNQLKPGEPGALQVERDGKFTFLTFEMD
jgi:serine protease Do